MASVLVIENDPNWHLGAMRGWLEAAGAEIDVIRPHTGQALPEEPSDHQAVVALGGGRGADWVPDLTRLLSRSAAEEKPTLAFCASARAVAVAHGGATEAVERFQPGPRLVARRDAAFDDPLLGTAPMSLDVVWWRHEDLVALPPDAELLASTPYGAPEVFRIGSRLWGVQSHIELDADMVIALGGDTEVADRVAAIGDYLASTWKPVIERFVALAGGRAGSTPLRVLDQ